MQVTYGKIKLKEPEKFSKSSVFWTSNIDISLKKLQVEQEPVRVSLVQINLHSWT